MTEKKSLPLQLRSVTNEDVPFIFNSWLKSYRETGLLCKNVSNTIYFDNHHKILQRIVQKAVIMVACAESDPSQIYGYMVAERVEGFLVVHYAYVKHSFRKLGIATAMLKEFGHDITKASCFTHYTKSSEKLALKFNLVYHPYLIMLSEEPKSDEC